MIEGSNDAVPVSDDEDDLNGQKQVKNLVQNNFMVENNQNFQKLSCSSLSNNVANKNDFDYDKNEVEDKIINNENNSNNDSITVQVTNNEFENSDNNFKNNEEKKHECVSEEDDNLENQQYPLLTEEKSNYFKNNTNDIENVSASSSTSPKELVEEVNGSFIAREMDQYMKVNKINFGEYDKVEDLWFICDAISAAHYGLPDSLLKDAFLMVLEDHLIRHTNPWMHSHLQSLIRLWKKEVQSEKSTDRPTKFVASSANYVSPVIVKKKKRTNAEKKKAQLRRLMGVGEMLEQARVQFATENGNVDVEEDEHGNFTIAGQELSFESWGKINRIKDWDIVHSTIVPQKTKKNKMKLAKQKMPLFITTENETTVIQPKILNNLAETSKNILNETDFEKSNGQKIKEQKPEKDEGELSESEDEETSDSSSSSGSDDISSQQSAAAVARHRRKRRRENERRQGQASITNISLLFQKFYQYRFEIAQSLTLQQKARFLDVIKKNNGGMSQQQLTQYMINYMNSTNSTNNSANK